MKTRILALFLILLLTMGATESQQENQFLARRVAVLETQVGSLLRRIEKLETQSLKTTQPKTTSRTQSSGQQVSNSHLRAFGPVLQVGQIAYLNGYHATSQGSYRATARVQEIIDATNMIVQISVDYEPHYPRDPATGRAYVYHDLRTGGVSTGPSIPSRYMAIMKDVWINGLSTTGLVDRSEVKYAGPLEITGTKTYTEWGDRTTLFVLEPVKQNLNP